MTATTPDLAQLSTRMREGSAAEHRDAESSTFMSALTAGQINALGYATFLTCFHTVYAALEQVGEALAEHPAVAPLHDPALNRLAAIESDLAYWAPDGVPAFDSPATQDYVAHIQATLDAPERFVAHHYTRYLGDLSGGQVIGRRLTRDFDLPPSAGVAFYEFPAIAKPKVYKDEYRATLDQLPLDEAARARVVDEVKTVFRLNGAVFAELTERMDEFAR